VLDLACGKGRHSLVLANAGLDVLGVDLSANSIGVAKSLENEHLHFKTGDMREPQGEGEFEVVFNLFTSFGYFEKEEENLKTLQSISKSLKPQGRLVIDFMNAEKALANLLPYQEIERGNILFHISKNLSDKVISKKIQFSDRGQSFEFEEIVQALTRSDFESYFQKTGFRVMALFGNYRLQSFDPEKSERMIFVVQKAG
jgi:SAM-dependent methyltransferase